MNVTSIPLLTSLKEGWESIRIRADGDEITLSNIYPFLSVTDLKRILWIHYGGDPRWAPERTFIGVRSEAGIRPIEFVWPTSVTDLDLPDPTTHREPNPALVDEAGVRKPVNPTMIGGLILETALSPEIAQTGSIPALTAISLDSLVEEGVEVSDALFGGFYQLYFPWLTQLDAVPGPEVYAAAVPYTEDREARIGIVEKALKPASFDLDTFVRLRWVLPPPTQKPESLEATFYALRATPNIPFIRYFPAKAAQGTGPLLKVAVNADGAPVIADPKILAHYLNQPAPNTHSAVVVARSPLSSESVTAFTIHLFEDGTCDVSLDVPQRGATFVASIAEEAERLLKRLMTDMGFAPGSAASLRDIHATYKWGRPGKPLTASRLQTRAATLTPFLEQTTQLAGDPALATFQWRATSNYESESAQHGFITQLVLRGINKGSTAAIVDALQKRFGITEAAATTVLERWLERKAEAVAPVQGGGVAVARHSSGALISLYSDYRVEIQGVEGSTELRRILSIVGVLMTTDLALKPPVPAVQAVIATVEEADAKQEEAVAPPVEEVFDMDDLLAGLGFGGGEEDLGLAPEGVEGVEGPVKVEEELKGPVAEEAPGPANALAALQADDECSREPLEPGTILHIEKEYYMDKLNKKDPAMFGYGGGATSRNKVYSKSCQRQQDRQPNIMTLEEYARVKKCYGDNVRFVDLPPRKPGDLPDYPDSAWSAKKEGEFTLKLTKRENFIVDPITYKPLWTVYGYESKTVAGAYRFLLCSELWCEHDNLPLIKDEFEKNGSKCPFCGGTEIEDVKKPRAGQTVIVRQSSKGNIHNFIGLMNEEKIKHPSGYPLPCCDSTPRLIKHFLTLHKNGKLAYSKPPEVADIEDDEGAEPPPEEVVVPQYKEVEVDYRDIFRGMQAAYILGNDKALEAGKIAILPPILDAFFAQKSTRSLKMQGIRPTFDDGVNLFVRVGVDTQTQASRRGMNLFAGLAPLLGMRSPTDVMRLFLGMRIPQQNAEPDTAILKRLVRAFEAANYGTLLMEFAAKSTDATPSQGVLEDFADRNGYTLGPSRPHVIRLYRAWTAYLRYILDPKTPKKLRHFEHLLAQPGPVIPRGQLLIVLEQDGDNINIVCPTFGIPMAPIFQDVPVSVLWHDVREDSWEPIVLYNGTSNAVLNMESTEMAKLPRALRASITSWVRTWKSGEGCARPAPPPHAWTPDHETSGLPRLTGLLPPNVSIRDRFGGVSPTAIVRDRSNRLAGVVYTNGCFVPCLDDGGLLDDYDRLYEAEMIPRTPWAVYEAFYGELVKEFRALRPTTLLSRDGQIIGFQVEAGSMIPIEPMQVGGALTLAVEQLGSFPWEMDALILRSPDSVGSAQITMEDTASLEEQAAEAYQHLRLSFSRFLSKGAVIRRNIQAIMTASWPLYEKRKRMDILLEPKIREFLLVDAEAERIPLSLIRQDCLSLPQASCRGQCSWSEGRCLIHVPSGKTDPAVVFTARLSDELLRFARLRREVLEGGVPTIRTPKGAARVGNELYVATKPKEATEDIMGRLGFEQVIAAFPEELLRFEGMDDDVVELVDETVLPPDWGFKGFAVPRVADEMEDPRGLMFAGVTGRSLEDWASALNKKRGSVKPFNWSSSDIQLLATILLSNLLFVRAPNKIEAWYAPELKGIAAKMSPSFSIFWGGKQLLLSKGKIFKFKLAELPTSLREALDGASPSTGLLEQGPVAPEKEVEEAPVVSEKEVEEAPVVSEKGVEEAPVVSEKEAEEAQVVSEKEAEEAPVVSEKEAEEAPVVSEKEAEEAPVVSEKGVEEAPVVSEKEAEEAPVVSEEAPVALEKEAEEAPVVSEQDSPKEASDESPPTLKVSEALPAQISQGLSNLLTAITEEQKPATEVPEKPATEEAPVTLGEAVTSFVTGLVSEQAPSKEVEDEEGEEGTPVLEG